MKVTQVFFLLFFYCLRLEEQDGVFIILGPGLFLLGLTVKNKNMPFRWIIMVESAVSSKPQSCFANEALTGPICQISKCGLLSLVWI